MSDEIEDEAAEDLSEEDLIAEEEIVISTVAVGEGDGNASNCPVCREEFDQFYKQVRDDTHDVVLIHAITGRCSGGRWLVYPQCCQE